MRRSIVIAAASLFGSVACAFAADEPPKPGQALNPAPQGAPTTRPALIRIGEGPQGGVILGGGGGWVSGGKSQAEWYIKSTEKTVSLTEEQKKSITKIFEDRDKAQQDFQKQNTEKMKAASEAMTEAYKSKDKDAIAKAQKQFSDIYAPMQETMKKSQADLNSVLTQDQRDKLREARIASAIRSMTEPATLTEEQLKKIKAAVPKEGEGETREAGFQKAVQETLTDEQKAQIGKHRAMNYVKMMFTQAKLTDEQMKKAESAYDEWAKDKSNKPEAMYKTMQEKVQALLTDEQKEQMKKAGQWGVLGQPGAAVGGGLRVEEKK